MQIGKRVQRLEHAQLAADKQRIKMHSRANIDLDKGMGMDLDARYDIPISRNDPVNIYNFVRTHREDPAITVSLPFEL